MKKFSLLNPKLLPFVIMLGMSTSAWSQMVGFSVELDTVFQAQVNPNIPPLDSAFVPLETYGVYHVYAEFTNEMDFLSALYTDSAALNTPLMGVDASCGCFTHPAVNSLLLSALNTLFFAQFPEMPYSSGWTIGASNSDEAAGVELNVIGLTSPLCQGINTNDGGVFLLSEGGQGGGTDLPVTGPEIAFAGPDLRVLVAQITTCGDVELQTCGQVFVNGYQNNRVDYCPDAPVVIDHMYGDGVCDTDTDNDGVCDEFETFGCDDAMACNYSADATQNDGSCTYPGCMDEEACNFDPNAGCDDESCLVPGSTCDDGVDETTLDEVQDDCSCQGYSCHDEEACNFSLAGLSDDNVCAYAGTYTIVGDVDPITGVGVTYTFDGLADSQYTWSIDQGNGQIISGQGTSEIEVFWFSSGSGTLCVVEEAVNGCRMEDCLQLSVTSSIEVRLEGALDVFPVPASDRIHVVWTGETLVTAFVTLRDASGRVVSTQQVAERDVLEVGHLSAGSYMLEFEVPSKGLLQRRVVIQ